MSAQHAFGQHDFLHAKAGQPLLHDDLAGQQAGERRFVAIHAGHRLEQRHHAAALGEQRLAGINVRG